MVWRRRLEDRSIAIRWLGFRRATKCAEFFTRRQWLNGRFSEGGLSHDDGRTNKHGPCFAARLAQAMKARNSVLSERKRKLSIKSFSQRGTAGRPVLIGVPKRSTFCAAIPTMPPPQNKGTP
ncbi:hypothetical protein KCP76_21225 [Salmonella enterica subsp. enterica serovar Weltevreden]|nr:hypothetical protein KCP76_21225 [Salmonella enterica subsp. enterica serovar Weltevreden]